MFLFIINFIGMPAFFILFKARRKHIFIAYIGLIIGWGIIVIQSSFEEVEGSKSHARTEIKFEYKGRIISSTTKYSLIFFGYKNLIMQNDSTNHPTYDIFTTDALYPITCKLIK